MLISISFDGQEVSSIFPSSLSHSKTVPATRSIALGHVCVWGKCCRCMEEATPHGRGRPHIRAVLGSDSPVNRGISHWLNTHASWECLGLFHHRWSGVDGSSVGLANLLKQHLLLCVFSADMKKLGKPHGKLGLLTLHGASPASGCNPNLQ